MDDVGIVTHRDPDGDCLGSAYALAAGLKQKGKRVSVIIPNEMPGKYKTLYADVAFLQFTPRYYVSVDVATRDLLGNLEEKIKNIDLCIDHHPSNTLFAKNNLIEPDAASTCEIIYDILKKLDCEITREIASYLYIGIITDTGCFQFANTTAQTHIIAAELITIGINYSEYNRVFFSTKSRARMEIEKAAIETLEFHFDGRAALMVITQKARDKAGADDEDLDGITPIPRQIEGVEIGITLREAGENTWRASIRTNSLINAAELCGHFGGGGHIRAGGCTVEGSVDEVKQKLLSVCESYFYDN